MLRSHLENSISEVNIMKVTVWSLYESSCYIIYDGLSISSFIYRDDGNSACHTLDRDHTEILFARNRDSRDRTCDDLGKERIIA